MALRMRVCVCVPPPRPLAVFGPLLSSCAVPARPTRPTTSPSSHTTVLSVCVRVCVFAVLAMCPNTPEVWVYTGCTDPDPAKWEKKWVLKEHDMLVSGIDWHPITDCIVTCSHDRNAFVWSFEAADDVWRPTIAILRINRAATSVKWSPDGAFASACGVCVSLLSWPCCRLSASLSTCVCVCLSLSLSVSMSVCRFLFVSLSFPQ